VVRAVGFACVLLLTGACTSGGAEPSAHGPSAPSPGERPPRGSVSAAEALEALCVYPDRLEEPGSRGPAASDTLVNEVSSQVERLRGLAFRRPVRVEVVSQPELVRGLRDLYAATVPEDLYARRSLAWQTIGVIRRGTDISEVFRTFGPVDVIGYYLPGSDLLRMIGERGESGFERFVLSHELTHALDDQHFDLGRIEELTRACRDDAQLAATAVVEGNATVLMYAWAASFLQGQLFGADTILPRDAIQREGHPPLFMGLTRAGGSADRVDPQPRVPRDDVEVAVLVEDRGARTKCLRRDQAIGQGPDGLSGFSTRPVDPRGALEVFELAGGQDREGGQDRPHLGEVPV